MTKAKVSTIKLSDIQQDQLNANAHSERGEYMVRNSIGKFKFAEAGTLDKDNRIVGGNLRTEVAADVLGADEAIVIEVDGSKPVFIKRNDIDLTTPEGRELAIALNRAADTSITWDAENLATIINEGVDLSDWFQDFELEDILADFEEDVDLSSVEFKEFDERVASEVKMCECPNCGRKWAC